MSCLIPLLEEQIEQLQKQVKNAAFSHDAQFAQITSLTAENNALREKLNPTPPMMEGTTVVEGSLAGEGDNVPD